MGPHVNVLVLSTEPELTARTVAHLLALGHTVAGPVEPFDPGPNPGPNPGPDSGQDLPRLAGCQLALLDVHAGALNAGLRTAERIRASSGVPVLLLVGESEVSDPGFIDRAHPYECLLRPYLPSALRTAVELALARNTARQSSRPDEDRYRDLVENSYDLICTHDIHGKLLSVNAAAERALGYPREAWAGGNIQDWLVPETRHLFPLYLAEILQKGSAHGVMRMRAANGEVREWEYHNSERRLEDGTRIIRGLAHDVTEQLEATRALRASEQRFRALFEQAAVGVVYMDTASGDIRAANQKCAQIMGCPQEDLLTRQFPSLIHTDDLPRYERGMARLAQGEVSEFVEDLRLVGAEGVQVWVALSVSPLSREGAPSTRHMAVVQDISQRKLAEREREILEAQLRQAQKMEAIGTLAGGIAHDFNNLLTMMVGNIELARLDVPDNHPVVTSLDAIGAAAHRATELVRQILAFSRKQPSKRAVIDLAPVIADSARLLRASIPTAIEINLRFDGGAPLVMADATQVHQVVMNLCTNAWQAIGDKVGCIDISLDAVDVQPSHGAHDEPAVRHARIRVSDTGAGMDAATLERVFEPFFTTKAAGRGSGLGLSVAHGIVKDHGGTISASSREGAGSTFEVLLPAAVGARAAASKESESTVPVWGSGRVLYIDDEQALTIAVGRMLESLGYHTTVCNSGAEAIRRVRENPLAFDIVLTDLTMPGLSGIDVARELMRIRPQLPVILTSGHAERAGENLAALGISQRLDKPFDRQALSEALSRARAQSMKAVG